MPNYFVIKNEEIENIVLWDGVSLWSPPDGTTIEPAIQGVQRGFRRINAIWVKPENEVPESNPAKISVIEKLAALGLTEDEVKALVG